MTTKLPTKRDAFVKMMKEGDEYERRGFELLLQRSDFKSFFDVLADEGLFDPSRNPGPIEGDMPGYYQILPWRPLPYLEAVGKLAGERNDAILAEKIVAIIRGVSAWRDNKDKATDNYFTWSAFAKILSFLPSQAVSINVLDLIGIWLEGRFGNALVGNSLISGPLLKFLSSDNSNDWAKATRILHHCTAIRLVDTDLGADIITKRSSHGCRGLLAQKPHQVVHDRLRQKERKVGRGHFPRSAPSCLRSEYGGSTDFGSSGLPSRSTPKS